MIPKFQSLENSKLTIKYNGKKSDLTFKEKNDVINITSKKYNIPKKNIKIDFSLKKEQIQTCCDTTIKDFTENIQSPDYIFKLIQQFIKKNNIECDIEEIRRIDNIINDKIDYNQYEKYRLFKIEWLKWKNFLCYGEDNYIDLRNFNGLVSLTSEPENQGGKSVLSCELIEFLLYGKISSGRAKNNSAIFNAYIPDAKEVIVEGGIEINGEHYIIKRTLKRPKQNSAVSGSVKFYKINNGKEELLEDCENLNEDNNNITSGNIKDIIGNHNDFNMSVLVNTDNLNDLITMTPGKSGELFNRWIGLKPLEDKYKVCTDYYNKNVKTRLKIEKYRGDECNIDKINNIIELNNKKIENYNEEIVNLRKKLKKIKEEINEFDNELINNKSLLSKIKDNLNEVNDLNLTDIEEKLKTATKELNEIIPIYEEHLKEYENIKNIVFPEIEYNEIKQKKEISNKKLININFQIENKNKEINNTKKNKICPTCGQEYPNINDIINKLENELNDLEKEYNIIKKENDIIEEEFKKVDEIKRNFDRKNQLELSVSSEKVIINNNQEIIKTETKKKDKINSNNDLIKQKEDIERTIETIEIKKTGKIKEQEETIYKGTEIKTDIKLLETNNKEKISLIEEIKEHEKKENNWEIYKKAISKNGISKLVLDDIIPSINNNLSYLLDDVCDFDVEIELNNNGEILFYKIKNGVKIPLHSGSGFEETVSSLALRCVLARYSAISRPTFMLLDEVFAKVSPVNFDNLKKLLDKILKEYDFIFIITHTENHPEWFNHSIKVTKINDVSSISSITHH